jgi:ABC-type transport system involved in multi-copper enzyme maturation permease subunit
MIGRLYAIALNTFREAIRHRIIYGILAVAVGFNLFAIVIGAMSLHQEARIARDVGLAGVSLFGSITAIVLGVSLLYGEVQRRTIYTIVSKPLERFEFVLGKYLGMALTLTVLVAVFAGAMAMLLRLQDVPLTSAVVVAVALGYLEVLVVAAIAIFFSSFSSPYLSGVFSFGLFFLGRVTPEMRAIAEAGDAGALGPVIDAALYVVPDLHLFGVSGSEVGGEHVSVHGDFVGFDYLLMAGGYAVLVIAVLLALACAIFSRRDFV